jgi:predicted 3-demethylubiquinone-9 3-methyltransferase (glyoxalase superfamily)
MQKITPYLWFDNNSEEAMKFYASVFPNAKIKSVNRLPEGAPGIEGNLITGSFEIDGFEFMIMNAGPQFKINPSISFFVNCDTEKQLDDLYKKLAEGGKVLMELNKYDFAEKYAWVDDKYEVSWQLMLNDHKPRVRPLLMYIGENTGKAEEAMKYYVSLFPDSKMGDVFRYPAGGADKEGTVMHAVFTIAGQEFLAMDSAIEHKFQFNEGVSLYVDCKDQAEVDKYWHKFLADGGEESMCGWLRDKYGVSWQIIPRALEDLLADKDQEKAGRVMQAMLKMKKIVVKDLEDAYEGR